MFCSIYYNGSQGILCFIVYTLMVAKVYYVSYYTLMVAIRFTMFYSMP